MPFNQPSPIMRYLIILSGFVMGFVYSSASDPSTAIEPIPGRLLATSMQELKDLKIDYSIVTNPQFKNLQVFGELPVQAQAGGKDDPFR